MADRVPVSIRIGGTMTAAVLAKFAGMIAFEGLGSEWGGEPFDMASRVVGEPVELFDERYTSVHAEQLLMEAGFTKKRRKERLDKLAAQILLTAYLESSRNQQPPGSLD